MFKFLLPALILEAGALTLLSTGSGRATGIAYLVIHAASSALLALTLLEMPPLRQASAQRRVPGYLFTLNFMMPVVGIATILAGYFLARRFPEQQMASPYDTMEDPDFWPHRNHEGSGFRAGQVRARLIDPQTAPARKMQALVAIQDTPARITKDLLRHLLSDPGEDIRLLAYGILDGKEKKLTRHILELEAQVTPAMPAASRCLLHRQLAELYWELIYQNLVQGDMWLFSADQVRHHAGQALQIQVDAGMWFLLARTALLAGHAGAAEESLKHAQQSGGALERLLPYLAELRFLQKRFDALYEVLMEVPFDCGPTFDPVRSFWLEASLIPPKPSRSALPATALRARSTASARHSPPLPR